MRNLQEVYRECIAEMDNLNIPYGRIVEITVNRRSKRRWGQCRRRGGVYMININVDLLADNAPLKGLKETIIHEILHTCPNCMKHTGEWKRLVGIVNNYYGYNIKRCDSAEDKGLDDDYTNVKRAEARYRFRCADCGSEIIRYRESKFTRNYERYVCGRCKGKIMKVCA